MVDAVKKLAVNSEPEVIDLKDEATPENTTEAGDICDYLQEIFNDIDARKIWNDTDNTIIEYRGGKRGKKNRPYKGAPNPVVNILDDVTSDKNDTEISMVMNTPRLVNVVAISKDCPIDMPGKVAQGLDTIFRYGVRFRMKKDVSNDMKNLRGFSVTKLTRTQHPKFGTIPDFDPVDCKDCIVPVDTQVPASRVAERMTFILRLSPRQIRQRKKTKNWQNTEALLELLTTRNPDGTTSYSSASTHDDEKDSTLKIKQKMNGINVSDFAHAKILVYETFHYATEWDVKNDPYNKVKVDEACVSYVCPDAPKLLLKIMPWRQDKQKPLSEEELQLETIQAQLEGREPATTKTVTEDKPWPGIQARYENKSLYWYDTWGLGRKCLDNHITATRLKKKKLIFTDYATNPMFVDKGTDNNTQNVMPSPGKKLPVGVEYAKLPVMNGQIDFDIDAERRDASQKGGGSGGVYSSQVSQSRKLQKTATEVQSENAQNAVLSSASVDRFNDPDIELFEMYFEDCRALRVKLPIITNGTFSGFAPMDIYNYEYIFSPATSQKHLNPNEQFLRDMQAYDWATQYIDKTPMRIYESMKYILSRHDPHFTDILLQDPKEDGPQGEPSVYDILRQLMAQFEELGLTSQQQDKEIEVALKETEKNADEIDKLGEEHEKILDEHKELKSAPTT